jgi:hypothetical protein
MADVTLQTDRFPQGTKVAVYPEGARQDGRSPAGQPVAEATVGKDQTLEVTGLEEGRSYVAYAKVDDEHRYVFLNTLADRERDRTG